MDRHYVISLQQFRFIFRFSSEFLGVHVLKLVLKNHAFMSPPPARPSRACWCVSQPWRSTLQTSHIVTIQQLKQWIAFGFYVSSLFLLQVTTSHLLNFWRYQFFCAAGTSWLFIRDSFLRLLLERTRTSVGASKSDFSVSKRCSYFQGSLQKTDQTVFVITVQKLLLSTCLETSPS